MRVWIAYIGARIWARYLESWYGVSAWMQQFVSVGCSACESWEGRHSPSRWVKTEIRDLKCHLSFSFLSAWYSSPVDTVTDLTSIVVFHYTWICPLPLSIVPYLPVPMLKSEQIAWECGLKFLCALIGRLDNDDWKKTLLWSGHLSLISSSYLELWFQIYQLLNKGPLNSFVMHDILILLADKGQSTVVMDGSEYDKKRTIDVRGCTYL